MLGIQSRHSKMSFVVRELDLESKAREHSEALKSIAAREEALKEGERELQRQVEIRKIDVELREAELNSIGKRLGYRVNTLQHLPKFVLCSQRERQRA